jgi:tetratricopeptide (TPR) repeat protein
VAGGSKGISGFYAGKLAMMNGQTERAIADFNTALAEGGDAESEVHLNLAQAYEASGDTRLALDHYLKTLRSENPDIFGTHRQTAQAAIDAIWMNMGPQLEAVRRRAMENADDFVSQAQAAEFFLSIGKYDDAKGLYTGALSLQPSSWQAWHNLGLTHMKSSDCERAIEAFEKGLAINPGNTSSLNNLGHCHGKLNQTEQAVRSYERALEIDPVFFSAAFNLGRLHFAEGDREKAQEYLLLALEMTPPGDPYRSRIDTYLKQIDGY